MKMFMLDLETTNTTNFEEEDILQIGLLELNANSEGFWVPGKSFSMDVHTDKKPRTNWDRENLGFLFARCANVEKKDATQIRQEVVDFIKSCGSTGMANLCGLNATILDVPFMAAKKYLHAPTRDDQNQIHGDYHYRVYEMSGAISLAQDVLNIRERNSVIKAALFAYPEMELPPGQQHEALFDCYSQTRMLNGLIRLLRKGTL